MRIATNRTLLLTAVASSLCFYIGVSEDAGVDLSRPAGRIQKPKADVEAKGTLREIVAADLVAKAMDLEGNSIAGRSRAVAALRSEEAERSAPAVPFQNEE